jgi:hypothetical protein
MEWQRIREAVKADKFETRRRGLEGLQVQLRAMLRQPRRLLGGSGC